MADPIDLVVAVSLRVTGILAAAWLVTLTLRRASAAIRHMVWTCGMGAAVLAPVLLALPAWRVPLPAAFAQWAPPHPAASRLAPDVSGEPVIFPTAATPVVAGAPQVAARPGQVTSGSLAVAAWASGCGVVLLYVFSGMMATLRLRRAGRRSTASWTEDARALAAGLGIARVTFAESSQTLMPFVCGIVNPLVIMPVAASSWTSDRLRAVLLHELAHVKRRDCLMQLLARVACAVYWFHPLAWLAAHRLHVERERACDDVVLTSGVRGSEYARHLVDIAQAAVCRRSPFAVAGVAMAHRGRLERRLMSILDPHLLRTSPRSARLVVAAFGIVALASSLRVQAQAPVQAPAPVRTPALLRATAPAPGPASPAVSAEIAAPAPVPAPAQVPPTAQTAAPPVPDAAFEVVSIKRNREVEALYLRMATNPNIPIVPGRAQTRPGGVVMGRNMTVREMIRDAYGYRNRAQGDIVGGPGWIDTERYDIQARAGRDLGGSSSMGLPPAAEAAMRAMLAERMNLRIRRESPVRPIYELVLHREDGRFGPNLKVSKGGCIPFFKREAYGAGLVIDQPKEGEPPLLRPCPLTIAPGVMGAENMTMEEWARLLALAPQVNKPVIDRTGLTGGFDFMLGGNPDAALPGPTDLLPAMKPGLERFLGLTLRDAEAPVEILVIENVERPTDN